MSNWWTCAGAPPAKNQWLSPHLVHAMQETLAAGEQTLLFLNRRGYAPLVLCKACGEAAEDAGHRELAD